MSNFSGLSRGQKRGRSGAGADRRSGSAGTSRGVVVVSKVQNGNPVLKHLRQVTWRFGAIEPDFVVGAAAAAIYISVRYNLLHPGYLRARMMALTGKFRVRILLVHIDVDDSQAALHALSKLAFAQRWSIVCGWTCAEIARYIETYKFCENRPADLIQGRVDDDYSSKLVSCLTAVRLVNKTDVATLVGTFGTPKEIITAPSQEIQLCAGIGERKAARLAAVFREPFVQRNVDTSQSLADPPTSGAGQSTSDAAETSETFWGARQVRPPAKG
eukprot:COSAG05_NODE_1882_length_3906_cov_1.643814_4_plen_272_part_00